MNTEPNEQPTDTEPRKSSASSLLWTIGGALTAIVFFGILKGMS